MSLYLDHNATTPLKPSVKQAMQAALEWVGNPSSIHGAGRNVRRFLENARDDMARLVNTQATHVTFTSGATESNNTVLRTAPVTRILVSDIEHPSVFDVMLTDKKRHIIPVDHNGVIDLEALEKLLAFDTQPTLISVMAVNNETGVIQPVQDIARLAKKYNALVHCDAVQMAGRLPIDLQVWPVDYLVLSAHKMGGPAGIGALICGHDLAVQPLLQGGGQERRRRAGTENMVGIAGFGAAARAALADAPHYQVLKDAHAVMERELQNRFPALRIAGQQVPRVGNTSQIIVPGVASEKQLMALDLAGVAVSSGSACSSGSVKPSHVLLAMGVPQAEAKCAIRISSGWNTTAQDLQNFTVRYTEILQRLQA